MSETSQGSPGHPADGGPAPAEGTVPGPERDSGPESTPSTFSPDPAQVAGTAPAEPVRPGAGAQGDPEPVTPDTAQPPPGVVGQEEGAAGQRSSLPAAVGALAVLVVIAVLVVLVVRTHDHTGRSGTPATVGPPVRATSVTVATPDQRAQTELIRGITLLKSQFSYLNTYGLVTLPWLDQRSPGVTWVTGATPVQHSDQISLAITPTSALVATRSSDGACWYVLDAEPGATAVTTDNLPGPAMYFSMEASGTCDGATAPVNGWGQTFPQP